MSNATREAIANAICHRDYTGGGGAVSVAMYDGRLEIVNPGFLPFGLTPDRLLRPHESHPWNPIIAGVFYRAGVIERWGTGTLNILDWCAENASPNPSWTEQAGSVFVTFLPAAPFGDEQPESGPESRAGFPHTGTSSTHSGDSSPHNSEGSPSTEADPVVVAVRTQGRVSPELVRRAILALTQGRFVSLRELSATLDRAPRTLSENYLRHLLEEGQLELRFPDRPNHPAQAYRAMSR